MFRTIVFSALLAGLIAGILISGLQALQVVPLILEAETYEVAAQSQDAGAAAGAGAEAEEHEAWAPAEGFERGAFTLLANVLAAAGFGLLITAGFALKGGVDWRKGLLWGLGGFAAVHLAPALGLPPEVPGVMAAELVARQGWWLLTVALTAAGLALLAFAPRLLWKGAGIVLIVVPHVIGAPHPEAYGSQVPAELAAAFVAATLVTNAVFWLVLGGAAGFFFQRLTRA
jgi:cobalt transporter subunit CbtA